MLVLDLICLTNLEMDGEMVGPVLGGQGGAAYRTSAKKEKKSLA